MSSRLITLIFCFGLSGAAYAAFTDTATTGPTSAWNKVTTTVKVKVNEWWSYWNPEAPVEAPVKVAEPTAVEKSTPQSTAETTTPTPATPVTVVPVPSQETQNLHEQPIFESREAGSSLKDVQAARDAMKSAPLLKVSQPGRVGSSKLAKTKAGVPIANWNELQRRTGRKVPRLDIGTESTISRQDFTVTPLHWGIQKPSQFKRLPTAAQLTGKMLAQAKSIGAKPALGARSLQAGIRPVGRPLSSEAVDKIQYSVLPVSEIKELPYKPLSDDQLKMLAALLLFDKGNHCHMIMGLFHQLAASDKVKTEATFHLGACAAQLKMHQSAFDKLSTVVTTQDKDFAAEALGILAKDLLIIYEKDFYRLLKGLKNPKALITEANLEHVAYRMAKGAYRAKDYKTSVIYASQVSENSNLHDAAQFLIGMNHFALGDKSAALKKLQELWASLEARNIGKSNIRALTSVNLARMYFSLRNYDKAIEHYMKVPKDHPLWVQALVEQGWSQVASEDFSGAIGNMYSLHSPYFKAVYQPESFVVRTIGYLNICQYGDAYKTLTWLEKDYRDWQTKTARYLETRSQPDSIYSTVKSYIRGKSTDDVDGVPYQVWREMAHRKDFLNLQTALNDKHDETKRYEGVNQKIKDEKASIRWRAEQSKKRFDQWRNQIAKSQVDMSLKKNLAQMNASLKLEKDLTIGYRFQLAILEQSRQGYMDFQSKSQAKLNTEGKSIAHQAGTILLSHAGNMQKEMARVLENNEFLRYEVFSGSGENIRYQVSGGKVDQSHRVPASIKPTKMMNWNFDGEFWEDEIGSYRSSLHNNCPANMQATKAEAIPAEQARHNDEDEN